LGREYQVLECCCPIRLCWHMLFWERGAVTMGGWHHGPASARMATPV
jgi:hypothetical protein